MKTFKQFITEAKAPKPDAHKTIAKNFERRHKGMTARVGNDDSGNLRVKELWQPPSQRNKGVAGRFMKGLGKYADKTGKNISLRASPEEGQKSKLHRFYSRQGFKKIGRSDNYIRTPNVNEGWIPPTSKKLRGGKESPLSAARKKGTNVDIVRQSVKRYAEPINRPENSEYDYKKDDSGKVTVTSRKHPISVSYTPGDKPNTFIQNTTTTGKTNDKIGAGRTMQQIKRDVASSARPGAVILSQPVGSRRASLNTRTQGMGSTNEKGVQGGIVRHRSPKQKQRSAKPLDPIKPKGIFIDH